MDTHLLASTIQSFELPYVVAQSFASYPYEIIFISLLLGGGIILFPAFYLSVVGVLEWLDIIGIMILAAVVSDTFWYLVGFGSLPKFMESRIGKERYLQKLTKVTEGKELTFLFYSKFIYGTRIATQILCGARKVNFLAYLLINMVTAAVLGFVYYGVIRFTAVGVDSLGDLKYKLAIILSSTMLAVGALHFILYRLFRRKTA